MKSRFHWACSVIYALVYWFEVCNFMFPFTWKLLCLEDTPDPYIHLMEEDQSSIVTSLLYVSLYLFKLCIFLHCEWEVEVESFASCFVESIGIWLDQKVCSLLENVNYWIRTMLSMSTGCLVFKVAREFLLFGTWSDFIFWGVRSPFGNEVIHVIASQLLLLRRCCSLCK